MTFTPTVLGTGLGGFAFLQRTRETQQDLLARSPQVARETQQFLEKAKTLQTSDQLLDDRAMLKVALGAFGLDDDLNNRAFLQRILDSDLTDSRSLANRLADKRYLALAETFNFAGTTGPSLARFKSAEDVGNDLAAIRTVDELLGNRALLTATLQTFGLERDVGNTFFLKSVLESDLNDSRSFANRLSDPRYAELAAAFGLGEKTRQQDGLQGFARILDTRSDPVRTTAELMADPQLLAVSLNVFGLQGDAGRTEFLESVLNSDLGDPGSFANQLEDKRYAALAGAFGFVERATVEGQGGTFTSKAEAYAEAAMAREQPVATTKEFFSDIKVMLASFALFDLPSRPDRSAFVNRILESDRDAPTSLINVFPDARYRAMADALDLKEPSSERVYPPGFAEAIVETYLDRQFEIRIGEANPTMRFALALERDLSQIVNTASSNDAQWFAIMASKPMREVFETVFQLPASFGTLDIDRQLGDLKARSEQFFGTSRLADYVLPENLENLRLQYLARSENGPRSDTGSGNLILTLLAQR